MDDKISLRTPPERFCSVRSLVNLDLEPLAGSAMQARSYIFVSWPKLAWARRQFESRGFPSELANFLIAMQKERKVFTRLFKPEREIADGSCDIMIMGAGQVLFSDIRVGDIKGLLEGYFEGRVGGTELNGFTIFCCTHGKRDLCCAKFGLSVVHSFREGAAASPVPINVFECTHIGADRFAATAVSFPHQFMYGRLRTENVPLVLSNLINGFPYIPCYRGRLGLTSPEQIAEMFGYQMLSTHEALHGRVVIGNSEVGHSVATVEVEVASVTAAEARFLVTCKLRDFATYMDCDGVRADEIRTVRRWVLNNAQRVFTS